MLPRPYASGSCRCGTQREIPPRGQPVAAAGRRPEGGGTRCCPPAGPLACRRHRIRLSCSLLRSMSGSWYRLTRTSAACSPVPGRPLLIRRLAGRRAAEQPAIILANLDQIAEDLTAGAVVVIGDDRSGYAASQCLANPLRSATGRPCRISLRGINQAVPLPSVSAMLRAGRTALGGPTRRGVPSHSPADTIRQA